MDSTPERKRPADDANWYLLHFVAAMSIWSSLKDLPVQMVLYQDEPNCFHTDL